MKNALEPDRLNLYMRLLQPSRPILVTTLNADGGINVAPFSWATPISAYPPMIGLALLAKPKAQKSLENIHRSGEFVINLPDLDMAEVLVKCSYQHLAGVNKFTAYGFTHQESQVVNAPGIGECDSILECIAEQIIETGDHELIIASVKAAAYDPEKFDKDLIRNLQNGSPCIHFGQLKKEEGQEHIFAEKIPGYRKIDVEYVEREKKRKV